MGASGVEKLFPAIETMEGLRRQARNAGIAGLVFAGMTILSAVLLYFTTDTVPGFEDYMDPEERSHALLGMGIEAAFVLFLTWRVWAGRGYVSGILLLILFLFEVVAKLVSSPSSLPWIVLYGALALSLVNGIRAALAWKRVSAGSASLEAF